jgi:predicted NBD/HSP70 family sugar kinase
VLVLAYDIGHVVIGGGVSHAGEAFAGPIRQELERLRAVAGPAGELLPRDVLHVLPEDADPGAWGAVAIAAAARDRWRNDLSG